MSAKAPVPPALARRLIALAAPRAERAFVMGDMEEEFAARLRSAGAAPARRWYWRQTIASLVPLARMRFAAGERAGRREWTGDPMWRDVIDDLRYAVRVGRRNPMLSAAVTATMVLGIAVTTAVFTVVNGVLLRPLPFPHSERVVRIGVILRNGVPSTSMAWPDLQDYKRDARAFDALAGVSEDSFVLSGDGDPQRVDVARVDQDFARIFALRPAIGRLFAPGEFVYGAHNVVVLTHAFWASRFNSDRGVVGRTIVLDDVPRVVIGVLPATEFAYPSAGVEAFMPLALHPLSFRRNRGNVWLGVVGRMRPGVSLERARADLLAMAAGISSAFPDAMKGISVHAEPLQVVITGPVQGMLLLLGAAVAAVLLIACGNIANLLLGHSQARSREFAVRAALGGSRGRIRRQLLTESMLLSLAGGGLGMALAPAVTRMLVALYPGGLPRVGEVHVDGRVLVAALAATALAGLLSGIPMARRAAALDLSRDLRDGGRASGGRRRRRFSDALVMTQIAISVTLLFAAGLLIETFWRLTHEDPGFAPNGVLTFQLTASMARFPTDDGARRFYASLTESIGAIPGVHGVGTTTQLPFGSGVVQDVYERDGKNDRSPNLPMAAIDFASPSYFTALGIRIVRGRGIEPADDARAPRVLVIDESLAKREYPGEDPIGRVIVWNNSRWTIVGVARGVRIFSLWDDPSPEIYFSTNQLQSRSQYVVINSDLSRAQLLPAVRRELRRLNPTAALTDIKSMNERLAISLAAQRYRAVLIAALGAVALALSLVGIYGVVSYAVSRQTREIGIRMALGENAARIRWRVVLNALRLAAAGTAIGVALSLGAGKWLAAFLVGVNAHDTRMLAGVGATLMAVAVAAAYVPARRASLVDPAIALRGD